MSEMMKLLFTTRFSESCFHAIPHIAQWMDDVSSSLTILHVHDPSKASRDAALAQLCGFFAEADRYARTRRVLVAGQDAASSIASYLQQHPHDLLLCPASDQVGLPRPWHRSTRARLLQHGQTPLWTIGARAAVLPGARVRRVGCLLSRRSDSRRPLQLAAQYAKFHAAQLQLLSIVPEVDDSTIRNALNYDEPLSEAEAEYELRQLSAALRAPCEVLVERGVHAHSAARLIERARTDVLFVCKREVLRRKLWMADMAAFADSAGCPVICVDDASAQPKWNLLPGGAAAASAVPVLVGV